MLKALFPIETAVEGSVISVTLEAPFRILAGTSVIPSVNFTVFSFSQEAKIFSPAVVTVVGITTEFSMLQPLNAFAPIEVSPSERVIFSAPVHPLKA